MSDAVWWEFLIMLPAVIFATYAITWSVPAVIMNAIVSLGSFKHIIFMDQQLAKDINKFYDEKGYMLPQYQMPWAIGSRCFDYWVKYPFIRKRSTTKSSKFKVFMWVNALGMWSWLGTFCFGFLAKSLGII
ncbi:hypothetical protein [Aliivibrio fischeri]|uniref:hypothetical protein n=1 Tax=Aliivibrio fischeri TaxID=668 RepID=UPI0007C52A6F|nr:hypothetical protein [Aliivibrio fischeri]MCE7575804.1 hypothetical protein [Aliivibrio fischeri]